MKPHAVTLLSLALALNLGVAADQPALQSPRDKMSYALGMDIGRNITNQQIQVNPDILAAGIKAVLTGSQPRLTEAEAKEAMDAFRAEMMAKRQERLKQQAERAKAQGEQNKKEGEAWLAENKTKEGVITTASGLQYKVYTMGTGPKPKLTDTVVTHYRGTLINGQEFDSSYRKSEPVTFRVDQVIKGWQEALQLMPVGSKWKLFIPSDLAYGEQGQGPRIPPHAPLIFDLELLGIQEPATTNTPPPAAPTK